MGDQNDSKKPAYDPTTYWSEREHPNTAANPAIGHLGLEYLLPRLKGVASLLEIGPGVGRLFPLYAGIPKVCTLDISRNYADRAAAAAAAVDLTVEPHFREAPDDAFPFTDHAFEVGVFSHVLQHIPFEYIEHTMDEAARCCKKVIVLSGRQRKWPRKDTQFKPNWHCFTHDFQDISRTLGCTYFDEYELQPGDLNSGIAFTFARAG